MKNVTVFLDNGDYFKTQINGTDESISEYYTVGKQFNVGNGENDLLAKVTRIAIGRENYQLEIAHDFARKVKAAGLRCFLAESGTHGFYTDNTGRRVVSFHVDLGVLKLSGNYEPSGLNGTGWGMTEFSNDFTKDNLLKILYSPTWVSFQNKPVPYRTIDSYLNAYQSSSKFKEIV